VAGEFIQFITFSAVPIVAFLGWLLVPHTLAGLDGWRWVAIIGAFGAIPIWFIRLRLPESPCWLEQKGRHHAADVILSRIEAQVQRETGQPLPPPKSSCSTSCRPWGITASPAGRRPT
jgi:putative MFS transporter